MGIIKKPPLVQTGYYKDGTKIVPVYIVEKEKDDKFDDTLVNLAYQSNRKYLYKHGEKLVLALNTAIKAGTLILNTDDTKDVVDYSYDYVKLREFFEKEVKLNGSPFYLDAEQLAAINCNVNTLVNARAGSGKTRVLTAKLIDLFHNQNMNHDNVLAFCFNKNAALEVSKRLTCNCTINQKKLYENYNVVRTFHSFAKEFSNLNGKILVEERGRLIKLVIKHLRENSEIFSKYLTDYFLGDVLTINRKKFKTEDEYYSYLRNCRYETLNGEYVKSVSEKYIADFLFEHDIKYVYEPCYYLANITLPNDSKFEKEIKKYKEIVPDFYLPDYDIIWEHWGITQESGKYARGRFSRHVCNADEYIEKMIFKKKFWNFYRHKCIFPENKKNYFLKINKLIETSGHDFEKFTNGNSKNRNKVEEYLLKFLSSQNIRCERLPDSEIIKRILEKSKDKFTNLIIQFIDKFQQKYLDNEEMFEEKIERDLSSGREKAFLRLGYMVYKQYKNALASSSNKGYLEDFNRYDVDFNQCLFYATKHIQTGEFDNIIKKIKWILIDEYQDFSMLFYNLVDSIRTRNKSINVFCVGDNCQAINRFAGSETSFFESFTNYFPISKNYYVSTNYRSGRQIVNVSNEFMKKFHLSNFSSKCNSKLEGIVEYQNIESIFINNDNPIYDMLFGESGLWKNATNTNKLTIARYISSFISVINQFPDKTVLILNRTNSFFDKSLEELNYILSKLINNRNVNFLCKTIHKSKGDEADIVIVSMVNKGKFPLCHPDVALFQTFGENESTQLEDEAKLYYVAITRAKERLYIQYEDTVKSEYII